MPLPKPVARKKKHNRRVICQGFQREDGLWDIEGHLTDTKAYGFDSEYRGRLEPGDAVHDMSLRLTVDEQMVIAAVAVDMSANPFPVCPSITPNFQRLVGLRLMPGFNTKAREQLGGVQGCTHLVELLGPMATTAYQTMYPLLFNKIKQLQQNKRPGLINSCHAWSESGEAVKLRFPDWYKAAD